MPSPDDPTTTLTTNLRRLGLLRTAEDLNDLLARATQRRWSATVLLEHIVTTELEERQRRSIERRLKAARLGRFKPIADWDWDWLAEGLSRKQIAARVGRTRETISAQLRDDDFQALKRELDAEMAEEARTTLRSHVRSAATYWVKAAAVAAKRGDHRPARDLLLHAGVITRLGETVGPQMQVVIGMPGHPAIEPPSQEAIDAAIAREEAARDTIDMVRVPPTGTRHAAKVTNPSA